MPDNKLHDLLKRLRDEIDGLSVEDFEKKQRLTELVEHLEQQALNPDDIDAQAGLLDSLRDSIRQMEVKHPRTTAILNDMMVALGNMGI